MKEQNDTSIDFENVKKTYEEDLQKRIEGSVDVPEADLKLFKNVVKAVSVLSLGFLMLGGINYAFHNGPQEQRFSKEVRGVAKPTGLVSYVEYREFKDVMSIDGKRFYKQIDGIILGSILGGEDYYLDYDSDKKVDTIIYAFRSSNEKELIRKTDYQNYKVEFDKADKDFARYFEELSK